MSDVDEDLGEIVRCPYCGALTHEEQIERPSDYCHHEVLDDPAQKGNNQ
jgi:hypothetical protein